MKNFWILILMFVPVFLQAQSIKVQGNIEKSTDERVQLQFPNYLGGDPIEQCTDVKNGHFEFHFDEKTPQMAYLRAGKEKKPVFIQPVMDVELNFQNNLFIETYEVSGEGSEDIKACFYYVQNKTKVDENSDVSNIDKLENQLFQVRRKNAELIQKLQNEQNCSETAANYLKLEINFDYYRALLNHVIKKDENQKLISLSRMPALFLSELSVEKLNHEEYLPIASYRDALIGYVYYKTLEKNSFQKYKEESQLFSNLILHSENFSGQNKAFLTATFLKAYATELDKKDVEKHLKNLYEQDENGYMYDEVEYFVKKLPKAVKKEEKQAVVQTFPVQMINTDGNTVNISDYHGKVIYIDVWASWCGPCRRMFPYSQKLHKRFTKKQLKEIVFLYISIDRNETAWKKALERLPLEGELLFSPGGWKSSVCQYFKISSIPRYIIIGKDGKIVSNNAPRPADPKIYDILSDLIK